MTGRRAVVLLTLLGVGLVLLAGTRTWVTLTVTETLPGLREVTVPGRRFAPEVFAIALAAAAGAVVLATSGRVVRLLVAAGQLIAGAVVVLSAVRAATDTPAAVRTAFQDSLGGPLSRTTGSGNILAGGIGTAQASISIWPWVAALGGLLILLAGGLALIGGRSWPGPTRRYERSGPSEAAGTPPTAASKRPATASPVAEARADTPADVWDALSRGEDPTSAPESPT